MRYHKVLFVLAAVALCCSVAQAWSFNYPYSGCTVPRQNTDGTGNCPESVTYQYRIIIPGSSPPHVLGSVTGTSESFGGWYATIASLSVTGQTSGCVAQLLDGAGNIKASVTNVTVL